MEAAATLGRAGADPAPPRPAPLQRWLGRTGSNLLSASAAEVAGRGAAFVSMVLVARYLEPASFGVFNTLLACFALAVAMGNFGIDRVVLRDFARDPHQQERSLPTLLTLRVAASLVTGAVLVGFGAATGATPSFLLLAAAVLLTNVSSTLALPFYAGERFGPPSAAASVTAAVMAGLSLLGIVLHRPLGFFVTALVAAEGVRLAWLYAATRREGGRLRAGFSSEYARYALRESLPYGVLAVLGAVYFRIDMVMLPFLAGGESAGYYASAYRVLDAVLVLPGLMVGVLLPRLARLVESADREAREIYLKITRVLLWLGLAAAGVGAALAGPLLETLYTARYLAAAPAFLWLMAAALFLFWNVPNTAVLLSGGRLRPVVAMTAAATAANVLLNLVLIPRYGATGAAAATAASEVLLLALLTPAVCRRLRISPGEYLREMRPGLRGSELALLLDRERALPPR